ncbi:RraA family protein [Campylobacter devanensis]|uniref:RraA family protein n=1 Tax=Campylobacter devanensis TaxID=3161138 RepID=UPI000A33A540|nr:RraA family protein [Campylobacter sp. P0111]
MREQIIAYLKENRVSSTEVADAMFKTGAIDNITAVNRGHFCVGPVRWIYAWKGSNWDVHEQIQNVKKGEVVFVECFDCENKAIFGDLVSKFILLYKQASAIVVQGYLRDIPRLMKENWPVWCSGFTPIGCVNTQPEEKMDKDIIQQRTEKYKDSIAVCDDSGVVIIPKDKINSDFYKRLEFIEEQEDIWYECIDRKKWSTFDTICLKKYLNKEEK